MLQQHQHRVSIVPQLPHRVVGPTTTNGEVVVLGDNGANASIRTTRGGIVVRSNDFNPERITLDDLFQTIPQLNVGDHFTGAAVGILDYAFGSFPEGCSYEIHLLRPYITATLPAYESSLHGLGKYDLYAPFPEICR